MSVQELLAVAVAALGGSERRGQLEMANAVEQAFMTGQHLVVQAGTGTGKSLAYLVPAIVRAVGDDGPVVVSTATIALQRQLVDRDLPRLADALATALPRRPQFALLKGRGNYLCLNKVHNGSATSDPAGEPQEELFNPMAVTALGRDVQRLTEWAATTDSGDRDDLKPGVADRSWSQVSVSARECIGVARCPFGSQCFSERARARAGAADIVVTNHALLAVDAVAESSVLPEHRLLVVDEAHELADRVTSVATAELTSATLGVAARRIARLVGPEVLERLEAASATLSSAIHDASPGRIDYLDDELATYLTALRDAAGAARSAIDSSSDAKAASARAEAAAALTDICDTASRILTSFTPAIPERTDVVWLDHEENRGSPRSVLRVAPLSVADLLARQVFDRSTAVLTSATLTIGGTFDAMAAAWGLTSDPPSDTGWRGLDVGSPFQHAKSGILYVAAHLPSPGRDGTGSAEQLTEIAELITAAGGRTLGLFSSMRAARAAAEAMRDRLSTPVLCQGDDTTSALVEQFSADPATSLFGTLSLWQGVDVPGPSLSLVLIDRIPFPRPDDPLLSARQRAVAARGGNGFMTVAANHAALLLAQGAGRLLRRVTDRGVVAVLDSRMVTARYGDYLRASLPPFWQTTSATQVRAALQRLSAAG
ncbi:ATP-dependent helicase [Mycobacterium kansasii]|uniref:ATP-dependent DNA helicase n=1 Tax=Mycobacterium kansasii TaxID=1768 RepID=UPI000CDE1EA4|nr:ATP-dependent DNA helicase [Mycobacterium kansasii]POX92074.1 ATP-dependent helicase [Mycobacterium kansasii]POY06143.1 ATP-dependent helicase [Mycobacterium kansasii]POY24287.1 ATP-dependent helicase [Mycobacterium kansasii]